MSRLLKSNGDDYPEAADKHLDDAQCLLNASRYDGAGYHAGYVIECTLKTILQVGGISAGHHNISSLVTSLVALGGNPLTALYIPNPQPGIGYGTPPNGWRETMRYRAPGDLTQATAQQWVIEAERVFNATVQKMRMDGVI